MASEHAWSSGCGRAANWASTLQRLRHARNSTRIRGNAAGAFIVFLSVLPFGAAHVLFHPATACCFSVFLPGARHEERRWLHILGLVPQYRGYTGLLLIQRDHDLSSEVHDLGPVEGK